MIVDSHCHLDRIDLSVFDGSLEKALLAAKTLGVTHALCVCIDMENFEAVRIIAETHENVYASVGVHPTEQEGIEPDVSMLIQKACHPKVIAIGETGLDYFHQPARVALQQARFHTHIEASQATQKPLIIHTRQANQDTIQILKDHHVNAGVFHCFTESWEMAKAGLDLGLYISFSGILTFKNAESLREVALKVPLDRLLVETDAPYLTPAPFRGKANHPGLTRYVVEALAQLRKMSVEEISKITTENFERLFGVRLT